jgi:hypothetical protein
MSPSMIRAAPVCLSRTIIAVFAGVFTATAAVQKPDELQRIMQEKLRHSQAVLGALAEEGFAAITSSGGHRARRRSRHGHEAVRGRHSAPVLGGAVTTLNPGQEAGPISYGPG